MIVLPGQPIIHGDCHTRAVTRQQQRDCMVWEEAVRDTLLNLTNIEKVTELYGCPFSYVLRYKYVR
jgi:hypothetical protein